MSRSRRKTPIFGNSRAASDHPWKKAAARKVRRVVRQSLCAAPDGDLLIPRRWALTNPATSRKDGKWYCVRPRPEWMRK